jgi:hypothetical protein
MVTLTHYYQHPKSRGDHQIIKPSVHTHRSHFLPHRKSRGWLRENNVNMRERVLSGRIKRRVIYYLNCLPTTRTSSMRLLNDIALLLWDSLNEPLDGSFFQQIS